MIPHIHFDPEKTTTYTADKTTVRILFELAASFNMDMAHINIKAACLHENFDHSGREPVYLRQHPRLDRSFQNQHKVGKHHKHFYGTPGAGQTYLSAVFKLLQQPQFIQSEADMCLFHRRTAKHIIILSVRMDDFTVTSTSK